MTLLQASSPLSGQLCVKAFSPWPACTCGRRRAGPKPACVLRSQKVAEERRGVPLSIYIQRPSVLPPVSASTEGGHACARETSTWGDRDTQPASPPSHNQHAGKQRTLEGLKYVTYLSLSREQRCVLAAGETITGKHPCHSRCHSRRSSFLLQASDS